MTKLALFLMMAGLARAAGPVGGVNMPTLENERAVYRHFNKTWTVSTAEPNYTSTAAFNVSNADIHGDTEGDDLWTSLLMYVRTNQAGYLARANGWLRYFKNDYRACVGDPYANFCYDRDSYGADHLWGWGLVAMHEYNNDAAALTEAESLAALVERGWSTNTFFGCLPTSGCIHYGIRQIGRHLHLVTRVAEATGKSRWNTLRDKILTMLMGSSHWNSQYGMYFEGDWSTDQALGAGAYAAGDRIQSAFQIGVLAEAMWHAQRTTGRQDIKNRLIAMARHVDQYGLSPRYQYTASTFGIVKGKLWHSYSGATDSGATYWDPVYTTSLVNVLAFGYKLTGDTALFNRAFYFFDRGNKGIYGQPVQRAAGDGVIHHFVDTRFMYGYYDYNKGELQYTWALFDPANITGVESAPVWAAGTPGLSAFPNPASRGNSVVLSLSGWPPGAAQLSVYNLRGQKVAELGSPSRHGKLTWNPLSAASGLYLIKVKSGERELTRRVLIQR